MFSDSIPAPFMPSELCKWADIRKTNPLITLNYWNLYDRDIIPIDSTLNLMLASIIDVEGAPTSCYQEKEQFSGFNSRLRFGRLQNLLDFAL